MNRLTIAGLVVAGAVSAIAFPPTGYAQTTYTGTVERVWEDGFRLNTGERTLRVDSWDVYGDRTPLHITVGDSLSVTGEFAGREFDAFSITDAEASSEDAEASSDDTEASSP